jgi:pimeloyl-ACP methyl ester carboxylesterase
VFANTGALDTGTFGNGMQWARYGDGPRTVLWVPAGPGAYLPTGLLDVLQGRQLAPLLTAGYSVWLVTRLRNMPHGHTVADMADDYARLIDTEFGGRVDAVVGLSYGGMIVQYLAADHPRSARDFVIALSAASITAWGRDVDYRLAKSIVDGDERQSAEIMAEYVFPEADDRWQRWLAGLVIAPLTAASEIPDGDVMVEAEAEMAFDARDILARIKVPVLLITAEEDLFFTPEMVDETAAQIKDCTVVRYPGTGHLRAATSARIGADVLTFLQRSAT